jgi:hypothetical protein
VTFTASNYDSTMWSTWMDAEGPNQQLRGVIRRPVVLRDTPTLSHSFHYNNFFDWIGKLREMTMRPVYEEFIGALSTGTWGMVTNNSQLWVLNEAGPLDIIDGCAWVDRLSGPHSSTVELTFEWWARYKGEPRKIAVAQMKATWAAIVGHGAVEIRPFTGELKEFVDAALPRTNTPTLYSYPARNDASFGAPLAKHRSPPTSVSPATVFEERFTTTQSDSNLVGNIYFANYYAWQAKTVDLWVHSILPESFRTPMGEMRCTSTKLNHLREAMPFDTVLCRLSVADVFAEGVRLYTEFFRLSADKSPEKLAFGEYEAQWVVPSTQASWQAGPLPQPLRENLLRF